MSEDYTFPNYEDNIRKLLDKFDAKLMPTYRGKDITGLHDSSGGMLTFSRKFLYSAPKLEKIVFGVQCYREKLMTYTCSIWPEDKYALPIYSSFWAESQKGSYFLLDLYPLADCICDLDYLEQYLMPLEEAYEKGLQDFSKKVVRDPHWFKALVSPFYITADFSPSTKESQGRVIETKVDYLEQYLQLWKNEEPGDPEYMKPLVARKEAIRKCLKENDPGGFMLEKAVGQEMADLHLEVLF
jgi:hypothetical protein